MTPATLFISLLPHRALVPEAHEIAAGIADLGAVSPVRLLRTVREGHTPRRPLRVGAVDVSHLKPERAPERLDARRHLWQEDREVTAVLERDRLPVRHLELDLQAEGVDVPAARASQIGHRDPEMVESHHGCVTSDTWDPRSMTCVQSSVVALGLNPRLSYNLAAAGLVVRRRSTSNRPRAAWSTASTSRRPPPSPPGGGNND